MNKSWTSREKIVKKLWFDNIVVHLVYFQRTLAMWETITHTVTNNSLVIKEVFSILYPDVNLLHLCNQ